MSGHHSPHAATNPRQLIEDCIHHLEHVLPSQAPIRDFVHHNTLHGLQHLPFPEALKQARELTGAQGSLPAAEYRRLFAAGRIDRDDLEWALSHAIADTPARHDVLASLLIGGIEPVSAARLAWERSQGELPVDCALWMMCVTISGFDTEVTATERVTWHDLEARFGRDWTRRDLLLALTGEDILDTLRPALLRHAGAHLDFGLAAWHNPRQPRGFYAAWRASARADVQWTLEFLPEARREITQLPDDPLDAVIRELTLLGLPQDRWAAYLERLALEIPGWSGMFLWRHRHPGYREVPEVPVHMADWLAVRLVLERLAAFDACRRHWALADTSVSLATFAARFDGCPVAAAELAVRCAGRATDLPEELSSRIAAVLRATREGIPPPPQTWLDLAAALPDALEAAAASRRQARRAWPLYRLARERGLDVAALAREGRELLTCIDWLYASDSIDRVGYLWLNAYEAHYRRQIFAGLTANHGRWRGFGAAGPLAQLVFCMDDREEGIRRHVEEANPALETLGAAAHFNVFINWRGLDADSTEALCPVVPEVVIPSHEVREQARENAAELHRAERRARQRGESQRLVLFQDSRFGLLSGAVVALAGSLLAVPSLIFRTFRPEWLAARAQARQLVPTRLECMAVGPAVEQPATPETPRLGFTEVEAADRVQTLLRNTGLVADFAPLVAIIGHGSNSDNNPHLAAYDCGACSGRHSGPNARLVATLANRPPVRAILAERGIHIPEQSWFLAAEHNTCDDTVVWYDVADIPERHQASFRQIEADVAKASHAHARERCRRLFSAPLRPSAEAARRHVAGRRYDFAQPRPELGHVTNACAFFGRRAMSRGAYFDRRAFLISYDPTRDPEGLVLERHLLINGAVGAGISLEYFFSTVDNDRYGCGSKVTHNITGLFAVMEGASSDLRTGLPRQMIEIHEAMRLLVVVEHTREVLTAIYQRQPVLQELVGNGWLTLAVKAPDAADIHLFDPVRGWLPWQGDAETQAVAAVATVAQSADWFDGEREPLAPVLLTRPVELVA